MTEPKSLHDYEWTDFPSLVNRISMEQIKLFAIIIADEATYFTPERDPKAMRKAESGRYEIYKPELVTYRLEEICRLESDPNQVRRDSSPHKIRLKWFISPEGERGELGRGLSPSPEDPPDPMWIPFTRIIAEDNPANSQISGCEIKTPEYAICGLVHDKFWADYDGGDEYAKQDEIVTWIQEQYKLSENQAKAIDKVTRPLGKPRRGGLKKIKRNI